jgi:capsular polysaccharide export protein
MRRFAPYSQLHFIRSAKRLPAGASVLLWGRREVQEPLPEQVNILRVEDGFIRSVGLGAQFVPPVSWVFDNQGIYFDSTTPSKLEQLCNQAVFSQQLLQRAVVLQQQIVAAQITKYNTGSGQWQRPNGRTVVLVPGQVESDASIRFGAADIKQNLALLKAVRQSRPEAYLVYKPHPDVVAKARAAGVGELDAAQYCDEVISDIGMAQLLPMVDEVHVLTSLTGFEALLRNISVVCYGRPFYAGWGLTDDQVPQLRRQRSLSLPELVAATLILYPSYVSLQSGCYTSAEQSLQQLARLKQTGQRGAAVLGRKVLRQLVNLLVKPG